MRLPEFTPSDMERIGKDLLAIEAVCKAQEPKLVLVRVRTGQIMAVGKATDGVIDSIEACWRVEHSHATGALSFSFPPNATYLELRASAMDAWRKLRSAINALSN